MAICNPQMMWCFICHFIQLELIDVQRKYKRLVSYNKKHGTSVFKKHACHQHLDLYKKWGLFLLQRVAETKVKNKGQKRGKLSPLLKPQTYLVANGLTINQIHYKMHFLENCFYMLQKVIDFCFLLKICGFNIWFYNNVGVNYFHPITKC